MPEFLDLVPLNNLTAVSKVDGFARKVPRISREHFAKSTVLLRFAMSNDIALREIFDVDDVVGHSRWSR